MTDGKSRRNVGLIAPSINNAARNRPPLSRSRPQKFAWTCMPSYASGISVELANWRMVLFCWKFGDMFFWKFVDLFCWEKDVGSCLHYAVVPVEVMDRWLASWVGGETGDVLVLTTNHCTASMHCIDARDISTVFLRSIAIDRQNEIFLLRFQPDRLAKWCNPFSSIHMRIRTCQLRAHPHWFSSIQTRNSYCKLPF